MYSERTLDGIDRDPEQYFCKEPPKIQRRAAAKKQAVATDERKLTFGDSRAFNKVQTSMKNAGSTDELRSPT
jgi:hypothetical protein